VIVGDRILLAATDGRLFLLDHDSGETAWQRQLNGSIIGSPAVAFERLVVATDRGLVYCLGKPQQNKE
jgi:outer membrane protein assembly factor BamB